MKNHEDLKLFGKYVSFNIMSMIALSCYILVDTYFIATGMGADGLAALNLAIPVYSVINGLGLMLGIGGGTRYSISLAMKDKDKCDRVFTTIVYAALALGLTAVILGLTTGDRIAILFGADHVTRQMAGSYIRITLLFAPAFLLNNVVNCFVKNDGNPRLAMAAMITGCLCNTVFDYIFIFPLQLGMAGAALATGTAPVSGLLVLETHFLMKKNKFSIRKILPDLSILKESLPLGIPALVNEWSSGMVIIIFNLLILKISGNTGVAAYGVIANLSLVVIAVYTGIAQGIQPVLSDAYGRGNMGRIRHVFRYGQTFSLIFSLLIYGSLCLCAGPIVMIFNQDGNPLLQQIASDGIRLYFLAIPFAGFNIVLSAYFAAVEKGIPAQIISLCRGFLFIIPLVILMSHMLQLTGIWLSFPAAECMTALAGAVLFWKYRHSSSVPLS